MTHRGPVAAEGTGDLMSIVKKEQSWLMTISLVVLAALAIGIILIYARKVLIPFVLAVFIFQIASPILDFQMIRLRMPRSVAAVTTLLIVGLLLVLLSCLLADALITVLAEVKRYSAALLAFTDRVFAWLDETMAEFYPSFGARVDPNALPAADPNMIVPGVETGGARELLQTLLVQNVQQGVPKLLSNAVGMITNFLSSFVLISIFVIFLLVGRNPYVVQKGIYADIDHDVRHYLTIKTLISAVTGILVWLVLSAFRLELAGVFGILAFLLNFIPSIGSIVATLLPIPIAMVQYENPWMVVLVVVCPGMIQMVMGNGIEPKLMGKGLNLHPVTILLALAFWGLLWGIPGMFLAVPMTAVVRIVLMQFETLRPVGLMLAGRLPESEIAPVKAAAGPLKPLTAEHQPEPPAESKHRSKDTKR